jgi:hypothetical protein
VEFSFVYYARQENTRSREKGALLLVWGYAKSSGCHSTVNCHIS